MKTNSKLLNEFHRIARLDENCNFIAGMDSMSYEGMIEVKEIRNLGYPTGTDDGLSYRFVRYPGAQQLCLWLPVDVYADPGTIRLMETHSGKELFHEDVSVKVNGSVQLILDTLDWPFEEYLLQLRMNSGRRYELIFSKKAIDTGALNESLDSGVWNANLMQKQKDGTLVPKEEPDPTGGMWRVYRDGTGKIIPNEDFNLRAQSENEVREIFTNLMYQEKSPVLEYEDQGRGGYVIYKDGSRQCKFWYEFGGGEVKLFIDIPSEKDWERNTGISLKKRREVLLFIANTARREKAPSWRFEIRDREIAFY